MVHFARFAGFDDDADARARMRAHEVMVHCAGRDQRADRHAVGGDRAVGQHDQAHAVGDRLARFVADAIERFEQSGFAGTARERDVDRARLPAAVVDSLQRRDFFVGQDRMRDAQPVRVRLRHLQHVRFGPDVALERHDHFFADRVDRRVRDLREQLLEVVVQHARLFGHHRERRVVAHRAERIAQFADHRQQHELHRFLRVAERLHALHQVFGMEAVRFAVRRADR